MALTTSSFPQTRFGAIRFSPEMEAREKAHPGSGFFPLTHVEKMMNSEEEASYNAALMLDKLGYDVYVQEDRPDGRYVTSCTQVRLLKKGTEEVVFNAGVCNLHPQNNFLDFNDRLFRYGFLMLAQQVDPALKPLIKPNR